MRYGGSVRAQPRITSVSLGKGRTFCRRKPQKGAEDGLKGDRETTPIRSGPSAVADRQVLREGSLSFSKRISILTDRFVSLLSQTSAVRVG